MKYVAAVLFASDVIQLMLEAIKCDSQSAEVSTCSISSWLGQNSESLFAFVICKDRKSAVSDFVGEQNCKNGVETKIKLVCDM